MPLLSKAPSIGKGRNFRETISFSTKRNVDIPDRETYPFERHGARFGDAHLAPMVLPGEYPTQHLFTPVPARSRPITGPNTYTFTAGNLTNHSSPFTLTKGTYYFGHARKCPDLEDQKTENLDVPGPGTYYKLHDPHRQNSIYQHQRNTHTMFGEQADSRKRTAPAYRFGNQAHFAEATPVLNNQPQQPRVGEESHEEGSLFARMLRSSQAPVAPKIKDFYNYKTPRTVLPAISTR